MKGKASDICTKCKHCEGLDMFAKMYSCKHYNNYPDAAIGMDSEIDCCNFEEVTMNKVKGKVSDWCPKCKNCKGTTQESNGVHVWLTEVECEDPYDGMIKTLAADSDVCCSMFEVRKEKEPFNLNMSREQLELKILDLFEEKDRLNGIINNLEKEKAAHMKGIERLKKSQEKLQNQVKNLQTTNEESYKREEKLEDKVHKLERRLLEENKRFDRLDTEFLMPLARVLYPREAKICKPYSEILKDIKNMSNVIEDLKKRAADSDCYKEKSELLEEKLKNANELADSWKRDYERLRDQFVHPMCNILYPDKPDLNINLTDLLNDVKNLKIYAGENKSMYEDLKYWKERCHKAETDVTTLNSKVEILKARDYKQCSRIMELEFAVNKLQSGEYDDILAKDIEIKSLQAKYEDAMSGWKHTIESYDISHQTISDQEVTIKALLITIKEMCKEENGNA